jgi:biotin transport system substrate-specific component
MWNQKLSILPDERSTTLANTLLGGWMASSAISSLVAKVALVLFGSLLLAVSAQFKIPLYPVPVTGQTLVVLLIGMAYGPRLGGLTVVAYLFEGALGLPVFAASGYGFSVLLGPTAGYLFGFIIAAIAVGYLAERGMGQSVVSTVGGMVVGNLIIYLFGGLWLANFIGFEKVFAVGVLPFVYGDVLKIAVAAGLMPLIWRILKSTRS